MAHTAGWHMIRLQGVTSRAFCILLYGAEATGRPPAELQHHHAVTSVCETWSVLSRIYRGHQTQVLFRHSSCMSPDGALNGTNDG